jgi:hypothetical protein
MPDPNAIAPAQRTLPEMLRIQARLHGDRTLFRAGDVAWSFRETLEIAARAAEKTTPAVDNRKAQTMRLSPEVLEGLRVRAERFRTTQAALVEQYLREAFERHPVPPYQGI